MSSRSLLLSIVDNPLARAVLSNKGTNNPLVRRFVAGDQLPDALAVVGDLHDQGILSAIDYLGEDLSHPKEIEAAVLEYMEVIKALSTFYRDGYVSVKLTAIGLLAGPDAARQNLVRLLELADERGGIFIRVDMEGSRHTQDTLDIVRALHRDWPNLGTVIQSYLRRSDNDIQDLLSEGIAIRLVKGAYAEPPTAAFTQKSDVDRQFRKQMFTLLDSGITHAVATHAPELINDAKLYARKNGLTADRFEFEMLLGVRRDLQQQLVKEGWRMRVYIPYGEQWYPYFTRRLAERPANMRFLLKNLVKG